MSPSVRRRTESTSCPGVRGVAGGSVMLVVPLSGDD